MNDDEKKRVLNDISQHPERYSDADLDSLLDGEDELGLLKRSTSYHQGMDSPIDADQWWKEIEHQPRRKSSSRYLLKMVASFLGIILVTTLAYAAVIKWHWLGNNRPGPETITTVPAAPPAIVDSSRKATVKDTVSTPMPSPAKVIVFDNQSLSEILSQMATYYHLNLTFMNAQVKGIRLHFEWNQQKSIDENIRLLNSFEKINILREGNRLKVE